MDPQSPTGAPLWAIKAGTSATGIDYEHEAVTLADGTRRSFLALEAAAEEDLAEFGHVKTYDGKEVAIARTQTGNKRYEQFSGDSSGAADPITASNGRFSGGLFGHVVMDGKVHPATPAQTTPPARRVASDRRNEPARSTRSPQWSPVPWQCGDPWVDENGKPAGDWLFGSRPSDTNLESDGRRSPVPKDTDNGELASPAPDARWSAVAAKQADATATEREWKPGMWAAWYSFDSDGQPCWRPVLVVDFETARETISGPIRDDQVPIDAGRQYYLTERDSLEPMDVWPEILPRLRSHFETTTSQPPTPTPRTPTDRQWAWLSPSGLGSAVSRALAIPKRVVPHLVGRGGSMIRQIEDILGLIVGVVDGGDGNASVTVFGPQDRVDLAMPVIQCVSEGGRSILTRLRNRMVV